MDRLKNRHTGQTCWIVGKGPSLEYLRKEHIGAGPVITLNEAIIPVEALGLENPIYSMQKDGGNRRYPSTGERNLNPDCDFTGQCGDSCGDLVRPRAATLLLHDLESKYCFPDYEPRHVLNLAELGLDVNVFSLILALKAAQYMGCETVNFVSCDAHARADYRGYVPGQGLIENPTWAGFYRGQVLGMKPFLNDIDHRFITPTPELKVSFGVLVNDIGRLDMVFRQSEIDPAKHKAYIIMKPSTATKGLNKLLGLIEAEGADIAVLAHQDMFFRQGWLPQVKEQLAMLPESWIVAGIIGKDMDGEVKGRFHDMRIPLQFNCGPLPSPASCFDECVIIVNLGKGFRFDEQLEGFDLYGTMAVCQAWEMGGTAWIIDAFAEHYCLRPFTWFPDKVFQGRFQWLHKRFPDAPRIDSTVLGTTRKDSKARYDEAAA